MRALFLLVCSAFFALPAGAAEKVGKIVVGYEGTPPIVIKQMLRMAKVSDQDVVMDLGCGDGRIPIAAARISGADGICVELDAKLVEKARANAALIGVSDKVSIEQGDLFQADLSRASVITMFLWDSVNMQLRPSLLKLKPGTRILSLGHPMGDWKPDRVHNFGFPDWADSNLYLWIVPSNVQGEWEVQGHETFLSVTLTQSFQHLTGSAIVLGKKQAISRGLISGTQISFAVRINGTDRLFMGTVHEDGISGGISGDGYDILRLRQKKARKSN